MSADAYLVIRCDQADTTETDGRCGAEAHWPVRFEPHNHTELRRLLKEHRGWDRKREGRRLIDLCPDHAAASSAAARP